MKLKLLEDQLLEQFRKYDADGIVITFTADHHIDYRYVLIDSAEIHEDAILNQPDLLQEEISELLTELIKVNREVFYCKDSPAQQFLLNEFLIRKDSLSKLWLERREHFDVPAFDFHDNHDGVIYTLNRIIRKELSDHFWTKTEDVANFFEWDIEIILKKHHNYKCNVYIEQIYQSAIFESQNWGEWRIYDLNKGIELKIPNHFKKSILDSIKDVLWPEYDLYTMRIHSDVDKYFIRGEIWTKYEVFS